MESKKRNIDDWRKIQLAIAEAVDAWRIIPRLLVAGYMYVVYEILMWYQSLKPYLPDEFKPLLENAKDPETIAAIARLMVSAPTTSHSLLVSVVVGASAAVFGLYTGSGRKWGTFSNWITDKNEGSSIQKTTKPMFLELEDPENDSDPKPPIMN